ncbi:MAG: helix-turn-helix domain-containing protein [Candidatus Micrarchaeales archaeon]|nr:helix-turn-helix domain-containing protein [Candidatus Micrarchaeales archaeon]
MSQQQIAKRLGVAQAAISKYLSGGYSQRIKMVEKIIEKKGYEIPIAKMIASKKDRETVSLKVDELAANGYIVKEALKLI